ncbi:flagellar protofilament ribbon protein [Diplonema papillatum]|nr:flagellar protofilament ribbon protein [Diplonema papillatum]
MLEKDREDWLDRQMVQEDKHAAALAEETERVRRKREQDVQWYRDTYQKKRSALEWDLNDPNAKAKDMPARISDDDPRCGVSSLQKFQGEDLDRLTRLRRQQQQIADWTQAHLDAKRLEKQREDERDATRAAREDEIGRRMFDAESLQRQQKRQAAMTTANFNRALAEQKRREATDDRRTAMMKDAEEIANALNSGLLNEADPLRGNGCRTREKGCSREEMQAILNQQAQQREELRQRRIAEAEDERAAAVRTAQENAMARMLEKQLHDEQRDLGRRLAAQNKAQHLKAADDQLKRKRLYAPEIGEQFFKQYCPPDFDICADQHKSTR